MTGLSGRDLNSGSLPKPQWIHPQTLISWRHALPAPPLWRDRMKRYHPDFQIFALGAQRCRLLTQNLPCVKNWGGEQQTARALNLCSSSTNSMAHRLLWSTSRQDGEVRLPQDCPSFSEEELQVPLSPTPLRTLMGSIPWASLVLTANQIPSLPHMGNGGSRVGIKLVARISHGVDSNIWLMSSGAALPVVSAHIVTSGFYFQLRTFMPTLMTEASRSLKH